MGGKDTDRSDAGGGERGAGYGEREGEVRPGAHHAAGLDGGDAPVRLCDPGLALEGRLRQRVAERRRADPQPIDDLFW